MLLHFGYHLTIHPKFWKILCQHEVWLMHAHQSWQAASISRFRTAAALSSSRRCAWWQTVRDTFFQPFRNAIARQSLGKISSNGACMVITKWMYHLQIDVSLVVHCFSFISLPSVSGYSVNIRQDKYPHTTMPHYIVLMSCIQHTKGYMKVFSPSTLGSYGRACAQAIC